MNDVLKTIEQRQSCRNFKDKQIDDVKLEQILTAGLQAPFAGDQLCHFTVVQNMALLDKINKYAKEFACNMDMEHLRALGNDEDFNSIYHAPTLIIISGKELAVAPIADCSAAAQNILLAAQSLELGACWVFFSVLAFSHDKSQELYDSIKIPQGYKPQLSIALGYKNIETLAKREPVDKTTRVSYIL